MKLLLVFTFLAFICLARSAPSSLSKDRTFILPDYDIDDETHIVDNDIEDETHLVDDNIEDEMNITTTTTTRRSTYVFPTRTRNTLPSRRPWLTQRTTSVKPTTVREDEIDEDLNDDESGFKYFRNIRKFFKKLLEDIKKFIRNITGHDLIKTIQNLFNKNNDD